MRNRRPEAPYRGPVQQDRPARLVLFMRRHKRGLRVLLAFLFLLVVAGVAASFLRLSASEVRFAPYRAKLVQYLPFQIKTIQVEGRNLTPESDLMRALGTSVGKPIFGFSVSAARDRIDTLPFIDHATVERHMPDTIVIKITERSPVAVWQDHGQFILINRAGERVPDQGLEGKNGQAFVKLPLVVGEGANLAASTLVDALTANPSVKEFVVAAVRVGQRRWNLTLRDGATILLPEGQEQAALARLAQYQGQFRLLERPVVSIDMRLPDRMVIHQSPATEPAASQDPNGSDGTKDPEGGPAGTRMRPGPSTGAERQIQAGHQDDGQSGPAPTAGKPPQSSHRLGRVSASHDNENRSSTPADGASPEE
ncbi:cell division protein FtsQ/DivIB [Asaia sp. As-1742]|uniref:cell division protein FtsQ/DivIB n=1 Tax=Asaia sp. As-1742 TaxID=2608325 RepID=UPI001420203C|nr:FtsQ-type POTRA domain-containing protein [Asaia sp. As-1742]NIE79671.1 FtsQ-type POTRA domain-containing protein [Asaia sp. As-1742]